MNTVTAAPSASTTSPEATRVPPVVPGQASDHPSSAQPFTDVLSEQTSKASRDLLDKQESKNGAAPKSAKDARLETSSKKSVAIDASTPSVPVPVPVVPVVTPDVVEVAPIHVGVSQRVHPLIEMAQTPSTTQASVGAESGKADSKPPLSPVEADTSTFPGHPGVVEAGLSGAVLKKEGEPTALPSAPTSPVVAVGEQASLSSAASTQLKSPPVLDAPVAKVVAENVRPVGAADQPATSISTAGSKNPAGDQMTTMANPQPLGSAKVTLEAHSSHSMPAVADVGAKPEHLREALIHAASRPAESVSGPASLPLVHPQLPATPATSASPISALVAGAGASGANATARIAQPMPHVLDVGGLAGAISRPLNEGNGGYTVLIAMRPAELGQLQAVVTLHGDNLQVSITPQTQVGHDALANAVDTLKNELSRGGVNVNVTLHDPGSQPKGEDRPQTTTVRRESFSPDEPTAMPSPLPVLAASQIHLIL